MKIQLLRPNVLVPTRGTDHAGGYDIYMPEAGIMMSGHTYKVGLGFATAIPRNHVALILPRSGIGSKHGIELNNTCGVIDADYRGEWFATLNQKAGHNPLAWKASERLLQFIVVPVWTPDLEVVYSLDSTERGTGGLGSTGQ
jgi:dUTP pyrophosphatase